MNPAIVAIIMAVFSEHDFKVGSEILAELDSVQKWEQQATWPGRPTYHRNKVRTALDWQEPVKQRHDTCVIGEVL